MLSQCLSHLQDSSYSDCNCDKDEFQNNWCLLDKHSFRYLVNYLVDDVDWSLSTTALDFEYDRHLVAIRVHPVELNIGNYLVTPSEAISYPSSAVADSTTPDL